MISLSATLEAAANASSRIPKVKVTAENVHSNFSLLTDSVPHTVHRLKSSGTGYWIATAYDDSSPWKAIYYKRLTSLDAAVDWTAGWNLLVTTYDNNWGRWHELYVEGNNVLIVYRDSTGLDCIKYRQSTNGGASFSAAAVLAYTVSEQYGTSVPFILDYNTVYLTYRRLEPLPGYGNQRWGRSERNGGWSNFEEDKEVGDFLRLSEDDKTEWMTVCAREMTDGTHVLIYNGMFGRQMEMYGGPDRSSDDSVDSAIIIHRNSREFSTAKMVLGGSGLNQDFSYLSRGCSDWLGDYLICAMLDTYGAKADRDGKESGGELFFGRTKDMNSYDLIPANISHGLTDPYIAGVGIDGSTVVVPLSEHQSSSEIYVCDTSSWWGESPVELDITSDIVEDVNLNHAPMVSSKATAVISNQALQYRDHGTVKPGAIVRISGGYHTAAGDELQQRFKGLIYQLGGPTAYNKILNMTAMDMLSRATQTRQNRPHVLQGNNAFYLAGDTEGDDDYLVPQGGVWSFDPATGFVQTDQMPIGSAEFFSSIIGYDAGPCRMMFCKVRISNSITENYSYIGLLIEQNLVNEDTHNVVYLYYDHAPSAPGGPEGVLRIAQSNVSFNGLYKMGYEIAYEDGLTIWSADTDYWLMAYVRYGYIQAFYSTDGITWTYACDGRVLNMLHSLSIDGYAGFYSSMTNYHSSSSEQHFFSDFHVFSGNLPQSGSDVMRYMASVVGMDTDEQYEIYDTFDSAFSSRWDTPGIDGTWAISAGKAVGTPSGAPPTILLLDLSATDIIFKCDVTLQSDLTGIIARSPADGAGGYMALISTTEMGIKKYDAPDWDWVFKRNITGYPDIPDVTGTVELMIALRGPYITVYIDGVMYAAAYDTDYTEGYIGMVSGASGGSSHDNFIVDGFYKPVDVVSIRPKDKIADVMTQIAECYDGGYFFSNGDGELVFGVFDSTTADIDLRSGQIVDMDSSKMVDKVLTIQRTVGDNCYAEVRDGAWGRALGGHRYGQEDNSVVFTGEEAVERASALMEETQKISEFRPVIKGHPGLEIGDIVNVADSDDLPALDCRVLSIDERIGLVYEQSLGQLVRTEPETP